MDKESIFWIVLILTLIVLTVYVKFYHTQPVSLFINLSSGSQLSTAYPYQRITLPILVKNTGGSGVSRIPVQVYINGSKNTAYSLTIPVGKVAYIPFNFTPDSAGTFNITVVADPEKLYQVSNRALAKNSTTVLITKPEAPTPYNLLPSGNVVNYEDDNLGAKAFILASYISSNYSIGVFTPIPSQDKFLFSVLNITQSYLNNMVAAYASYGNGGFADSVWFSGSISPSVLAAAAAAKDYSITNFTFDGASSSQIKIDNSTTLCGWYQEGWIKTLLYQNSTVTCATILNESGNKLNVSGYLSNNTIYNKVHVSNFTCSREFQLYLNWERELFFNI